MTTFNQRFNDGLYAGLTHSVLSTIEIITEDTDLDRVETNLLIISKFLKQFERPTKPAIMTSNFCDRDDPMYWDLKNHGKLNKNSIAVDQETVTIDEIRPPR